MDRDVEGNHPARDRGDTSADDDALFEALENEDDAAYRAHRIEQLNAEFSSTQNSRARNTSAPTTAVVQDTPYPTLTSDQALLDFTTHTHRCVIHFAHPDFARCGTMDEHIRALAVRHYEVRFARVDVRDTPFVVDKLKVRVLPCVIGFKDGVGVERITGFEGLGSGGRDGTDRFSTATLEKRLIWKGILAQEKFEGGGDASESEEDSDRGDSRGQIQGRRAIRSGNARNYYKDSDDDDDWD
ncbi:putative NTP binding protein [Aspergillus heteromorphus CBS 117.55]|uniref:Putative NTP binding protein n=1 Tax=Aspergillus heteromorphus CBS 117.55 TaxID=1448321 RepID=A0A317VE48_9EURO|nr:putative NTP binding protein [Aspergillus heteromorphus CBS 117.55]PWY70160.1 putative NTP binding protein [Aspergillus heteromorphus CBS 117.55]